MHKITTLLATLLLVTASATFSSASESPFYKAYSVEGDYEDVLLDVQDAIINRGFVIDYTGHIGDMLKRTGGDVGSTKRLYEHADFMTFCSARLSRATMEADIHNINLCPYIITVYEPFDEKGIVYVSYRKPAATISGTPHKAVLAVEKVLDEIAREATE